jgi:hypothetical protein
VAISIRSCLTAGVAVITATAVAFGPSIEPARAPTAAAPQIVHVAAPTITLTAGVQPLAAASLTDVLGFIEHYVVPPSAGAPFPTPHFPPTVAPTSIGSSLIWIYNAVEPWARWIADVAAYAVGWIPYVGWLSGQIPIFYNFGERIARSITYNIAYWLDGNISFGQGLYNVAVDTVNAFIQLGIDQWNFWLWPLPPLPPIFPGALAVTTAELTTAATVTGDPTVTQGATSDVPKLKKKDSQATDAASEAAAVVTDEASEVGPEPGVDTPKGPKEPKPKVTTRVAAKYDESAATNDAPKKVPNSEKKADKGSTEKAAPQSSSPRTDSKGEKKDDTGKKDATE